MEHLDRLTNRVTFALSSRLRSLRLDLDFKSKEKAHPPSPKPNQNHTGVTADLVHVITGFTYAQAGWWEPGTEMGH